MRTAVPAMHIGRPTRIPRPQPGDPARSARLQSIGTPGAQTAADAFRVRAAARHTPRRGASAIDMASRRSVIQMLIRELLLYVGHACAIHKHHFVNSSSVRDRCSDASRARSTTRVAGDCGVRAMSCPHTCQSQCGARGGPPEHVRDTSLGNNVDGTRTSAS